MSTYRFEIFTLGTGGTNCGGTQNFTTCNATSHCLDFVNTTSGRLAVMDENGSMDVRGTFVTASVETNADFVIKNSSNAVVASINSTSGALYILGTLTETQGTSCTEPSEGFIIRNATGDCVSYRDNSGNLWLKGGLCYNAAI